MQNSRLYYVLACSIFFIANLVFAQTPGDFRSNASGNWGAVAIWDSLRNDLTWVPANKQPASWNNVIIQTGHTVIVEASGKTCKNLTIERGATLVGADQLPTSSLRYIRVYGTTVTNNGTLGSPLDVLGIQPYGGASQVLMITGSGITHLSRFQPQSTGQTLIVDTDIQFNYAGSSGTGSTALYCNNFDFTVTINPGKTVTMVNYAYIAVHGSSAISAGNNNFTLNIYGTLNCSGPNSIVNLNNSSGKTTTVNIYNGGSLITNSIIRANYLNTGTVNINIYNGGGIYTSSSSTLNLVNANVINNGIVDCASSNIDSLGIAVVGNTGRIRLAKSSFPKGNITFNENSVIEYYGTSPITIPAQPDMYTNLEINNSAGVTLSSNITVNRTLTLSNGVLSTGPNTLRASTVVRGNGYVDGILEKQVPIGTNVSVTYEIGSRNMYLPITMKYATVSTQGYVTVQTIADDYPNALSVGISKVRSLNRYWSIVGSSLEFDSCIISFTYSPSDIDVGATISNFIMKCIKGGDVVQVPLLSITATGAEVVTRSFGTFVLGDLPQYFTISTTTVGGGSIIPSGDTLVLEGSSLVYRFVSEEGHRLDSVLVNGIKVDSVTSYTFSNIQTNQSIVAYFSAIPYIITATYEGNGTISPSGNVEVPYGQSIRFIFLPETGSQLDSAFVDGVKVDSTTGYTFTNVTSNHTIVAYFSKTHITITATAVGNGIITPSGTVKIWYGESIRFTFQPQVGFQLDSILVDGVRVDSTVGYTFTNVKANHTITAYFSDVYYTITASVRGNGVITPSGLVRVKYGDSIRFTFQPQVGSRLDSVLVNGVKVDSTSGYTFTNVTTNNTITVFYSGITYLITASVRGNGTIAPSGAVQVNYGGTIRFTFQPQTGSRLDSVLVDGIKVDSTNGYTFINVLSNRTITVFFSDIYYTISATKHGNGTLTPSGTISVKYGTSIRFTFEPQTGYKLDSVCVDGVKVDSTRGYTFTNVVRNHQLDVYFSERTTSVHTTESVPLETRIYGNFPNPFNPLTTIRFTVAQTGYARVVVYNILGQVVAHVFDGIAENGKYYDIVFNASNLTSGIYFVRLESGGKNFIQKLTFTK